MSPGQILYHLYHRPLGRLAQCIRNGGPLAERETEQNRRAMEDAADRLGSLPEMENGRVRLHLMTGRRFWFQTMFCLHSFAANAGVSVEAELYDDGSIDRHCADRLRQLGPGVRIHFVQDLREQLDSRLPRARFPVLRDRWDHYPNIRKLIDVHLAGGDWKLVLDSDLLFFRRPEALLTWLRGPDQILHAVDSEESYGYSRPLLERLAGAPLPRLLNVGICGLHSGAIDWGQLEAWTAELQARENTNYYLEQALVAMLAARQPAHAVSAAEYVTFPSREETERPQAVMHHYVATSKRWYYRYGWRHVRAKSGPGAQ